MTATMARIDWLSWTHHFQAGVASPEYCALAIAEYVWDFANEFIKLDFETLLSGRAPYQFSIAGKGLRVYFDLKGDALFELSGEGCDILHHAGLLRPIVMGNKTSITRVDFAVDMECDTRPPEFTAATTRPRRTMSHVISDTGETVYVGSMKSPRFARVYRYDGEHERAGLLRAEHVFRGNDAFLFAQHWINVGDTRAAADCGVTYGWTHPVWTPENGEIIKAWRRERRDAKIHRWLTEQVAPGLSRAIREGRITPEEAGKLLGKKWSMTQRREFARGMSPNTANDAEK